MKNRLIIIAFMSILASASIFAEPLGTGFTYQGQLNQAGAPADGYYDFQFALYNILDGGIAVSASIQLENVSVQSGAFSVELDFGTDVYDGNQLWLEIGARDGDSDGAYSILSPRQKLTATPYALSSISVASVSQSERRFIGYSTNRFSEPSLNRVWLEGPQLCKADFGSTATMATSEEILRAINDGTFFQPPGSYAAAIRPVNLVANTVDSTWFDPNLHTSMSTPTAVIYVARDGFPWFESTSADVSNLIVTCSQYS